MHPVSAGQRLTVQPPFKRKKPSSPSRLSYSFLKKIMAISYYYFPLSAFPLTPFTFELSTIPHLFLFVPQEQISYPPVPVGCAVPACLPAPSSIGCPANFQGTQKGRRAYLYSCISNPQIKNFFNALFVLLSFFFRGTNPPSSIPNQQSKIQNLQFPHSFRVDLKNSDLNSHPESIKCKILPPHSSGTTIA